MELGNIVMKPTKNSKYIDDLRKERNYYRDCYESALKIVNEEIEKIKKTTSIYKKMGRLNDFEKMTSDYHLKFLMSVKEKLIYDNNNNI